MSEIQRKDIISDDALQAPYELIKGFEQFLGVLEKVYGTAAQAGKKIAGSSSMPGVRKETEQLTLAQIELEKIQKQIAIQQARNNEAYIQEQKVLSSVKQQLKDKIALGNQDAKSITAQTASLKELEAALAKNIRTYSLLKTEEERNAAEGQKLLGIITKQTTEVDHLSSSLGINKQKVGDYSGGIIKAWTEIQKLEKANKELTAAQKGLALTTSTDKQAFDQLNVAIQKNLTEINQYNTTIVNAKRSTLEWGKSLLGAAGLIGGIYGAVQAFRSFININKELEKSLSDLQALTGASSQDLVYYKEQAIAIGVETKRSARDVVEAFKLIGGARPDLLADKEALAGVTKEAIVLANASGIELRDAADALGGALNQLQLEAKDASRAINAYAAGAKEGAAEIPDINASYKEFGAALKANNGTLEQGIGLIETLATRQIKGAEAGVALRNVLIALAAVDVLPRRAQEQMAKFGVDIKVVKNTSLDLGVRLRELGKIAGDSSALVKVFGKENYIAGNIVLNNIGLFEELTKKVTGTTEAYRQAAVATDNLQGDLDKAASETSALAAEVGSKTQGILRGAVQLYIQFVEVLRALPTFLKNNQASFASLAGAVVLFNRAAIISTATTIRQAAAVQLLEIREKAALLTTRAFYTTLAANPFGLILLGVTALVSAIAIYDQTSARHNHVEKETVAINDQLDASLQAIQEDRKKLNISVEDYIKLSKEQQIELQVEAIYRRQQAEELLGVTKARINDLKAQAAELTGWQTLKAGLYSLTGAYGASTMAAAEFAAENAKAVDDQFADKLKALEEEISKYKDFLTDTKKADEAESDRALKAEKDNAFKLNKFRIEEAIKGQEKIRDAQDADYAARYKAEVNAMALRDKLALLERNHKLSNAKATQSELILAEEEYQSQLKVIAEQSEDARKKIAKERVENEREISEGLLKDSIQASENIIHFEGASLEQRNEALKNAIADKTTLLKLSYDRDVEAAQGNTVKLEKIQNDYNLAIEKLNRELADGLQKNSIEVFQVYYAQLNRAAQDSANQQLKILDDQFNNGDISARKYYGERQKMEVESNKMMMQTAITFLRQNLDTFQGSADDKLKIQEELSNAEIALSQYTAEQKLKYEQAYQQAAQNLQQTFFQSAIQISQNASQAEIQRLDNKINKLKATSEAEIALAGDNEEAKRVIAANAAAKERKLQDEKNRAARKQAQFQKALGISQAIINIAEGISQAFGEYPYPVAVGIAALIAAAGALEIATIASAPIPSYAVGTANHPGGPAIVGERGPELVATKSGKMFLTPPRATMLDLEAGSRVFTDRQTTKLLAMASLGKTDYSPITNGSSDRLEHLFKSFGEKIVNSTSRSNSDIIRHMATIYEAKKEHETFLKIQRSISMGQK